MRNGHRGAGVAAALALGALLAGCGQASPEDARAALTGKCERQFARLAPDPAKGAELCTCLTDKLAEDGLAITDMMGGDGAKVQAVARSCAGRVGISLPQ